MDKGVLKNIGCSVVDGNEESLLEALERAHRLGMKSALCMVLSRVFSDDVYESGIENPESVYIENTNLMGRIIGLYTDAFNEQNSAFVGKLNRRIQMAASAREMHGKMIVDLERKLAETKRDHLFVSELESELTALHEDICGEGK